MSCAKRSFPLWAVSTKALQSLPKCCGAVQGDVQLHAVMTCAGCWPGIAELGSPVTSPQVDFPMGYKGICMYCFETPPCSHLTDFLHPDGERRALPSSPLATRIAPHIPSLVSRPNASRLCFSPTSLPHTIVFRAALVPPAERSRRGVLPGPEALGGCVGLLGAHRQAARPCCPRQARGVRERNGAARRDISGELASSGNRKALFLCRIPGMIASRNTRGSWGD